MSPTRARGSSADRASPLLVLTNDGHGIPSDHADRSVRPQRLVALREALAEKNLTWEMPPRATREALERIHEASYLDSVDRLRGRVSRVFSHRAILPGSLESIQRAAGAGVVAVDRVMAGSARAVFGLVQPPGHHAESDRGTGFCVVDNVAVAAAHAIVVHGLERVLIVDWDVHHGNGTQHAFESRRDVLFFDVHQSPLFPGTGAIEETGTGAGEGYTVNVPLAAGCGDADYVAVFEDALLPTAEPYRPQLVLVSAGFDAHRRDPLGGMEMTAAGFAALCGMVQGIADRHAGGRLVLLLEGGYDNVALAEGVLACMEVLDGSVPPTIGGSASSQTLSTLRRLRSRSRCAP